MKKVKQLRLSNRFRRSFLLTLLLAFSLMLVACDKDENKNNKNNNKPKELNTELTDKLELDLSYEGKVFQTDRIGKVTLAACVDGDTAHFNSGNERITVRFLDIDTPETRGELQPWGKAASEFTCNKLKNANEIVLEGRENLKDTYGRYLAYVWYDGRLLNLEIVELAYSRADSTSDKRYGEYFKQAESKARATRKRIYGEDDPDYSDDEIELSLEELRKNIDSYMGLKVVVEGVVTRELGPNAFIEKDGYGIYIYTNHRKTPRLSVGNLVKVEARVSEFGGTAQLVEVTYNEVTVLEKERFDLINPQQISIPEITDDHIGALLQLESLTISRVQRSGEAKNIYVKDANGNEFMIRLDAIVVDRFNDLPLTAGKVIDIIAPLSRYEDTYQLMPTRAEDIRIH